MLTNGVEKLGKKIFSFSLPTESCKHQTEECKRYCYAKRGNFRYPHVARFYRRNFENSKQEDFEAKINSEINYLHISKGVKYIRIHSSGDFYSQAYFNKWARIARANPDVSFLAFTRNYSMDTSNKPNNLMLIYSVDESTEYFNPTIKRSAYVIDSRHKHSKHMEKHKKTNSRICTGKCYSCKFCWYATEDVSFPRRGK